MKVFRSTMGANVDYYMLTLQVLQLVGLGLLGLFVRKHLGSYLSKKGENLATKEDIADITRKVEEVRSEYALVLEKGRHRHELSLAALDRRLQIHQDAYVLWRKLLTAADKEDKINATVVECQDWWVAHCLYLDLDARKAFHEAYFAAAARSDLHRPPKDMNALKENWKTIFNAGEVILKAVQLPTLGPSECEAVHLPKRPD